MRYVFALTQKMAFVRDNYTAKLKLFNVWFICEFLQILWIKYVLIIQYIQSKPY